VLCQCQRTDANADESCDSSHTCLPVSCGTPKADIVA
jgi:hypothetical protein